MVLQPGCAERVVLVCCFAVASICLAGCVGLWAAFQTASLALGVFCCGSPVLSVFRGAFVVLLPVLCSAGFGSFPSLSPPDGPLVRLSGGMGRGRPFGLSFGCTSCFGPGPIVPMFGVLLWLGLLCLFLAQLYWRACCAGAGLAAMVARAVLVLGPPPWLGLLCWCLVHRHGRACCTCAGPPPWSGVRC